MVDALPEGLLLELLDREIVREVLGLGNVKVLDPPVGTVTLARD